MLDWSNCRPNDFSFEIDAEEIQEIGQRQMFPIKVFYKDGTLAFIKSIPLRSEFYWQLREREDWKEKLMAILKQRLKEEISQRTRSNQMTIDDKLEIIETSKKTIA